MKEEILKIAEQLKYDEITTDYAQSLLLDLFGVRGSWVYVNEEKPPVHEWVLLGNRDDKWVDRGERYRDGTYHNGECQVIPTHWCYLPEPPCV